MPLIYDGRSYDPIFRSDLCNAKAEIWIANPFLKRNRIMQLMPILSQLRANGVSITVFTRSTEASAEKDQPAQIECIEYLRSYGIQVKPRNTFLRCTVIDSQIVWYGSVNVLTNNSPDSCVMRLESSDIAVKLTDSVIYFESYNHQK